MLLRSLFSLWTGANGDFNTSTIVKLRIWLGMNPDGRAELECTSSKLKFQENSWHCISGYIWRSGIHKFACLLSFPHYKSPLYTFIYPTPYYWAILGIRPKHHCVKQTSCCIAYRRQAKKTWCRWRLSELRFKMWYCRIWRYMEIDGNRSK